MLKSKPNIPTHNQLFWPVVCAFRELDGSSDNEQLLSKLSKMLELSEEAEGELHKGGPKTELGYRVDWVKSWLKWGGMLDNPKRGVWVLTHLGRIASKEDVEEVHARRRLASKNNRKGIAARSVDEDTEEVLEDDWKTDLIATVKSISPDAFERLAKRLLLELGFSNVIVTGGSGDGGIDAIGLVKVNSVLTFKIIVQCKRFKGSVGSADIRNFRGAMQGRTDKALFITTGAFTDAAREEASRDGVPAIDLIDGQNLAALLKDLGLGVETKIVEKVSVVKEFFAEI